MKRFKQLAIAAVAMSAVMISHDARGQDPITTFTAGAIIDNAKSAAEDLIETAFDRVDQSVLLAAMETRATVSRTALEFENQRDQTLEAFDGAQRKMLTDLMGIDTQINNDLESFLDSVDGKTNKYVSSLNLLISSTPGAIHVFPDFAFENEREMEFTLRGVALSKLEIRNLRVNGVVVRPEFISRDDTEAKLRIPLKLSSDISEPEIVPVSFEVHKKKFLPWRKPDVRYYASEGFIIPRTLGTITVTFAGETNTEKRESKKFGPFRTPRVKSSTFGKSRSVTREWSATPDTGWKIDVSTAKFNFNLNTGGCSGRRSVASWTSTTDTIVRVSARAETDRKPKVSCRTSTFISFDQVMSEDVRLTKKSDAQQVNFGQKYSFDLSDFGSELQSARLAHIQLKKDWGESEGVLLTQADSGPLKIEYNPNSQIVYITPQFK